MTKQRRLVATIFVTALVLCTAGLAAAHPPKVEALKDSLRRFHSVDYAQRNGFALVVDVNGVSCIDDPAGSGNMGYHYANGDLVGDGRIDKAHPEAFLYESTRSGGRRLIAIEYVVLAQDWTKREPPELFDQEFMLVEAPNRFGLPDFYMLHAWLWKANPLGKFNPYNPRVHCP